MEVDELQAFRRLYEAFRAELGDSVAEACVRRALDDAVPAPQTPPLPAARRRRPRRRGWKRAPHPVSPRRVQARRAAS